MTPTATNADLSAAPLPWEVTPHQSTAHQDATSGHQRESSVEELAILLDKAQDAILVRDLDHRITYWNDTAEKLFGWSAEEVIGRKVREFLYPNEIEFDQ